MENKKLSEINILRAYACLAVILVHITASFIFVDTSGLQMKLVLSFINRALKFTTPTFIFISGFILYYVYQGKKISYFNFLNKRLKAILIPYILWTTFYYWYFIDQGIYSFSTSFFLEKMLLADMVYHLYFVLIILQFYVLFGLFRFLFDKYNSHFLILNMFVLNILFFKYGYFKYADRFFMQYIFFFALGCYIAKNYKEIKSRILHYKYFIIISYFIISIFYTYQFFYMSILGQPLVSGLTVTIIWFLFCLIAILFYLFLAIRGVREGSLIADILNRISDSSYYIYLSHPFFLILSTRLIAHYNITSTTINLFITIFFVFGLTLPLAIIYHSLKTKLYNYNERRKNNNFRNPPHFP